MKNPNAADERLPSPTHARLPLLASPNVLAAVCGFLTARRVSIAVAGAALLTGALASVWGSPGIESVDHRAGDLRTKWQATRLQGEHPRIALVAIDEETMKNERVRSPLSREKLARLVSAIASAGPKAIGLDVVVDQVADGDATLTRSIRAAVQAGVPVVVGTVQNGWTERPLPEERIKAQKDFLIAAGNPAIGHIYLRREQDGFTRARIAPIVGSDDTQSFAAVLAHVGGAQAASIATLKSPATARRIEWLGEPRDPSQQTFMRVSASAFLDGGARASVSPQIAALLKDRVVLIGADLDAVDRHRTPLTTGGDGEPGVVVHAQIAAQILDGRLLQHLPMGVALLLTLVTATLGILLGWGWSGAGVLTGAAVLVPWLIVDTFLIVRLGLVVPFLVPMVAWGGGLMLGEGLRIAAIARDWFAHRGHA